MFSTFATVGLTKTIIQVD